MHQETKNYVDYLQRGRKKMRFLAITAGLFLGALSLMSTFFIQLSGAVIANGHIIPEGENIVLQHPDGGLIKDVYFKDGDVIKAGDEIILFDGQELRGELAQLKSIKLDISLRIASTRAALNGQSQFSLSNKIYAQTAKADGTEGKPVLDRSQSAMINRQREVLKADRNFFTSRVQQIEERIATSTEARRVLQAQLVSINERAALIEREITELGALVEDRLVPRSRLTSLQREKLEIQQRIEALQLENTQLHNQIILSKRELPSLLSEDKNRLWTQLQADEQELANINYNIASTEGRMERLSLTAPVDGRVHELSVSNPGAVVPPGGIVLQIVPFTNRSEISVQIDLASIDDVDIGKNVRLRFDTFKAHAAKELQGQILQISPDRSLDNVTGLPFYAARIGLNDESLADFTTISPSAGAPITVMIETKKRSMANYLLEPVRQALTKTFTET